MQQNERDYLKPTLGRKVYCVYDGIYILVKTVGYIGKESFIIEAFSEDYCFDSFEWYYNGYNETWFTDLTKAKKKLLEVAYRAEGKKLKVIKKADDYYEVGYKGE